MTDIEFRRELVERRNRLLKDSNRLLEQIKACDALLGTLASEEQLRFGPPSPNGTTAKRMSVPQIVASAVLSAPQQFSIKDVLQFIEINFPTDGRPDRQTVASAFWKFAREQNLKIVHKGQGRNPTIYSKM